MEEIIIYLIVNVSFIKKCHELINNLFSHPYTKIEFVVSNVGVERRTVAKYLDKLVDNKLLVKTKLGRYNYYLNIRLINLLMNKGNE